MIIYEMLKRSQLNSILLQLNANLNLFQIWVRVIFLCNMRQATCLKDEILKFQ